jgi:hypothetical protein
LRTSERSESESKSIDLRTSERSESESKPKVCEQSPGLYFLEYSHHFLGMYLDHLSDRVFSGFMYELKIRGDNTRLSHPDHIVNT